MRWPTFLSRQKMYDDLSEEIQQHLEEKIESLIAEGMSREEATHKARREFGNVSFLEERSREQWQWPTLDSLWADIKFGTRQLRRYRTFTTMAVVTLALGIGANTAIFTLLESIVLRPLPFPQQDRLVSISAEGNFPKGWMRALNERSQSFSSIAAYSPDTESNITDTGSAERAFGAKVTVNTFDTLGIHPELGTFFSPENSIQGRDLVVILSNGYWKQRFGGNPQVVGETIPIDGVSHRIIGVMPAGVAFPYAETKFVVPVSFNGGDPIDPWKDPFNLRGVGRLKDGIAPAAAQAELRRLRASMLTLFPWQMPDAWAAHIRVIPLLDSIVGDTRPRLILLFAAVILILFIACANVANLMLARGASREREMAIRGALGASGGRIIRQLLIESLLLGALSGAVGLTASALSLRTFTHLLPPDTPRVADVGLHWQVFLFAFGTSLLTGILFGLIPAIRMATPHLQQVLRSGSISVIGKHSQFRLPMLLVIGQIGLSVVVITAAGLMLRSLYSLSHVDPGFRTSRIVTAEVSLDAVACRQAGRCQAFFQSLLENLRGTPGIESVAVANELPMSGIGEDYIFDADNHFRTPGQLAQVATKSVVSAGYFKMMGLQLLRGRLLNDSDASGASRAVVINENAAATLWPGQDPLGKHVITVEDEQSPGVINLEKSSIIVGVVGNTHHESLAGNIVKEVYLPITQRTEQPSMAVLILTRTPPEQAASGIRNAVASIDPLVPVTRVQTLDEVVAASTAAPRSLAILLVGFGLLAVGVGATGVYSLIAYIVSWRTREIGIRLALGAPKFQIMKMVMRQSMLLAAAGSAVGIVGAILSTRLLRSFLFEVSPFDPMTYVIVSLLMLLLALLAGFVPARRAASVDPMEALRNE